MPTTKTIDKSLISDTGIVHDFPSQNSPKGKPFVVSDQPKRGVSRSTNLKERIKTLSENQSNPQMQTKSNVVTEHGIPLPPQFRSGSPSRSKSTSQSIFSPSRSKSTSRSVSNTKSESLISMQTQKSSTTQQHEEYKRPHTPKSEDTSEEDDEDSDEDQRNDAQMNDNEQNIIEETSVAPDFVTEHSSSVSLPPEDQKTQEQPPKSSMQPLHQNVNQQNQNQSEQTNANLQPPQDDPYHPISWKRGEVYVGKRAYINITITATRVFLKSESANTWNPASTL